MTATDGIATSGPATVTVACMFILSGGLQKTGALAALGAALMRVARWPWLLLLLIMVVVGGISAFVNNTAAVAVLLIWAGLVEGFLSQYHEPVLPYAVKILFGLVELTLLTVFLARSGRGSAAAETDPA